LAAARSRIAAGSAGPLLGIILADFLSHVPGLRDIDSCPAAHAAGTADVRAARRA
jgi:hypothetical protein